MFRLQGWYTVIAIISEAVALGRRPVPPHRPFSLGLDGLSGWHHWQEVSYRSNGPMGGRWNRIHSQLPNDLFSRNGFPYKPIRASCDWSEPMMRLHAGPGLAVSSRSGIRQSHCSITLSIPLLLLVKGKLSQRILQDINKTGPEALPVAFLHI